MFIKQIFAIALACALAVPPSYAAEITRSYRAVMHVRDAHAKPVLDRPDHVVGIGTFRGLAIFKDGDVAVHRYQGWFDLTNGSGKFHGYALWRYEDGSELRAAYDGSARKSNSNEFRVKARFHHFEGTGRYTGVSGEGAFEGKRFEPIDKGGSTLLTGELKLTLPK